MRKFPKVLVSDVTTQRFTWSPKLLCTWDSEQSCWRASPDMAKGKHMNRPFWNKKSLSPAF